MLLRKSLAIGAVATAVVLAAGVAAQDAAETAVILSTTGPSTGGASRSLGQNITQGIGGAAAAVAATNNARRSGNGARPATRGGNTIAATGDPLEDTDASTYRLGNGATIRVSGGMRPATGTVCVEHCEDNPAPVVEEEAEEAPVE